MWATALVTSYYASLLALTIRYLIGSMSVILPWSQCEEEWRQMGCIDSSTTNASHLLGLNETLDARLQTSAEMYF